MTPSKSTVLVPKRSLYAVVDTKLAEADLTKQWQAAVEGRAHYPGSCTEKVRWRIDADMQADARDWGTVYEKVDFTPKTAGDPTPSKMIYLCGKANQIRENAHFAGIMEPASEVYAVFESSLPFEEIMKQWKAAQGADWAWCKGFSKREDLDSEVSYRPRQEAISPFTRVDFVPQEPASESSKFLKKPVFFRSPHDNERGYSGVAFDVEYQFITCMGELHLAYSVVDNSVRIGSLPTASAPDTAHYTYEGHYYRVHALPASIASVPLKGRVYRDSELIGQFGDDFAAKALGFGCFSGQTKEIAKLSDFKLQLGDKPSEESMTKFLNSLSVTFTTNELLTSSAAEEEIRAGVAKAAAENDERVGTVAGDEVVREALGNKAAEERAARRAADEAEFQAKEKAYEEGMAAHKAALEQYQKSIADMEAQKGANAAAAKAQQEEFARKQADYEAELARARQAQADYEAKYGKPQ